MSSKSPKDSFVLIEGIPVPPGGKPGVRREFSTWATSTPEESIQVSLFVRALQRFYDRPYTDTLSYFQVAGIHGYPGNLAWDNSAPPVWPSKDTNVRNIYCTHNLLVFPTWHRPYMALYEVMGEVIENDLQFNSQADKDAWIKESNEWRLPYWDWALHTGVPDLFRPPSVKLRVPLGPQGQQLDPEEKSNPLYRFQLKVNGVLTKMGDLPEPYTVHDVHPPSDKTKAYPWSQCSGTSRYGIKSSSPTPEESEGINNYPMVQKAIDCHIYDSMTSDDKADQEINKHPVSDLVYRLLSNVNDWASFASTITENESGSNDWQQWISLEYIHNNMHVFIGGGDFAQGIGHMMNVPASAFDPLFYMHHCNVDRLFAIWQVLHKDSWFALGASPGPTDPLTPFHHKVDGNKVDYFDSNSTRDLTLLGYQYDVLQRKGNESDDQYVTRIKEYVDKTYRGTGDLLLHDKDGLFKKKADNLYDDYVINVKYDRYGYKNGVPYFIHFFLGAPSSKTQTPDPFPRHVGSVYTFSTPITSGAQAADDVSVCPNCEKQHDDGVLSRAAVPLTIPLYSDAKNEDIGDFDTPSPENVEKYLKENLSWVAVTTDGTIIDWSELKKTKVFVLHGKANHYTKAGHMSVYQGYKPLTSVTHDKVAGALSHEYD